MLVKHGHPRGLYICFFTEAWERFSFYGLRALLIFYLTQHFLFDDRAASHIYGSYFGMVYALPVIGGFIADRYLGFRKSVVLGGILLSLGHFGMAFEGDKATRLADGSVVRDPFFVQAFYFSLALIIVGVGFLKPNISTIVGRLYAQDDPRRDSGFTIFYMGINLGAAVASIACGYLGQTYGWKYGFGLAGVGMLAGLLVFLWGQKYLEGHAEPSDPALLKKRTLLGLNVEWSVYLGAILGTFVVWQMVQSHFVVGSMLAGTSIAVAVGLTWFVVTQCNKHERDRMMVAGVLTFFSIVFWALFEQAGSSMNLFADRVVDRDLMGWEVKASMFQALNPTIIILLGPVFAWLWVALARKDREPSTPVKLALGIAQVGIGFMALVIGASMPNEAGKVAMIWLVLAYLLHTMGELCLSPVGLSMITKLSVPRVVGMMMGTWFLATAAAEYVAALIAGLAHIENVGEVDPSHALEVYSSVFQKIGLMGIAIGLVLLALSPWLRKKMHGIH